MPLPLFLSSSHRNVVQYLRTVTIRDHQDILCPMKPLRILLFTCLLSVALCVSLLIRSSGILSPRVTLVSSSGTPLASTLTVLYVFHPSCGWCAQNQDQISLLRRRLSSNYRVVGVSLASEGLPEFIKEHRVAFPVYTDIAFQSRVAYRLGTTPETIVVAPGGWVVTSWKGAYVGAAKASIEHFFSVSLRGNSGVVSAPW